MAEEQAERAQEELPDPRSRSALTDALIIELGRHKITAVRKTSLPHPRASQVIRCFGGGLTQDIALSPDPQRPDRWRWYWRWADGLRGEGPITPEEMCPGEDIRTAATSVAKVLGVRPVAV